jgi:hypothetical protein
MGRCCERVPHELKEREEFTMQPCFKVMLLFLMVLFPLNGILAQESSTILSIQGDVQKSRQWSIGQLKKQFGDQIQEVKFRGAADYSEKIGTGVALLSVIKAAEPKVEKETKWTRKDEMHRSMVFLVIMEARDSYQIFFTLPELMSEFGDDPAYLIWDVDGKPLAGEEAPLRLVFSTDKWPDRGIYGIVKITLLDCNKLADQLKEK